MKTLRTTPTCVAAVVIGMVSFYPIYAEASSSRLGDQGSKARTGSCEREAEKLVGPRTVQIGGAIRPPKKTRGVAPTYPELPPGTKGSGLWLGEVLISSVGRVVRVWPLREVTLTPPFPPFNDAIVDAIEQWEFEPLVVQDEPAPFCMTVSMNINWK